MTRVHPEPSATGVAEFVATSIEDATRMSDFGELSLHRELPGDSLAGTIKVGSQPAALCGAGPPVTESAIRESLAKLKKAKGLTANVSSADGSSTAPSGPEGQRGSVWKKAKAAAKGAGKSIVSVCNKAPAGPVLGCRTDLRKTASGSGRAFTACR